MRYRYSWLDPNAANTRRTYEGTSHSINSLSFCNQGGQSIWVYDNGALVDYSCAIVSTLTITPLGPPAERYDCINGSCLTQSQYGTPGIYENAAACKQNCGPGCGGVCISNAEWSEISSLASQVKNKVCS